MLNPEIWKFKEPECKFQLQKFHDNKSISEVVKRQKFNFNHIVTLIIPDTLRISENILSSIQSDYYKIEGFNLGDLISKEFLTCFIRNGELSALSIGTRIDCDNCFCLTPSGYLVLNVDKETYQTLGIDGKISHFQKAVASRYTITINLKEDKFESKKYFERVKSSISKLGTLNIIFAWLPPRDDICPSTIAKYCNDLGYNVTLCQNVFKSRTIYSLNVPLMKFNNWNEIDELEVADFAEWLGMAALEGDFQVEDEFISTYETPKPNVSLGQIKMLSWQGMIFGNDIQRLIHESINFNQILQNPWIAIYVQGFSDTPVAWNLEEHHYYTNGDNGYIVVCNNEKHLIFTHKCSSKKYKSKEK